MKKNKLIIIMIILISIILCIPSIMYLIKNHTVYKFSAYYTFLLESGQSNITKKIEGYVFIGLIILFGIIYFLIIKNSSKIFKDKKYAILFIAMISFLFLLILPSLSSDIYYYIGDSWIASKYGANPYYDSIQDLQDIGLEDEILNHVVVWRDTTSVYGPLWNYISIILSKLCFGNLTIALFIYKSVAFCIHIANCILIYKITKKIKYMLLYGLNPLVLIEFLSNVHNDIYLIFFMLLSFYFLIKKKDKILTFLFLALSIGIKFSSVLIVPFLLIYIYKEYPVLKRILYCCISGIGIIAVVILLYMPFYKDYTIFLNMLAQGEKYSQSLMLYLMLNINSDLMEVISYLLIKVFAIFYITRVVIVLFYPKVTMKMIMREYNLTMLVFIFIVLTNFQRWYVLWLIPTIIWQSKYMRKFILYLTITAILPTLTYFIKGSDHYSYEMKYSINVVIMAMACLSANIVVSKLWKFYKMKKIKNKEICKN